MLTGSTVLVGVDSGKGSEVALRQAVRLFSNTEAELHLVHAAARPSGVAPPEYDDCGYPEVLKQLPRVFAHRLREVLETTDAPRLRREAVEFHLRVGEPAETILAVAEEVRATLIVLGARTPDDADVGRSQTLPGPTLKRVMRAAQCAVLVAREACYDVETSTRVRRFDAKPSTTEREASARFAIHGSYRLRQRLTSPVDDEEPECAQ